MWTTCERPQYVGSTTTINRQVDAGRCRLRAYLAHSARTGAQGCGQSWWDAIPTGLLRVVGRHPTGFSGACGALSQWVSRCPWGAVPQRIRSAGVAPSHRVSDACGASSHGVFSFLWGAVPRDSQALVGRCPTGPSCAMVCCPKHKTADRRGKHCRGSQGAIGPSGPTRRSHEP